MTKEQLVGLIRTKPVWNASQLIEPISKLELTFTAKHIPTKLCVGDIFFYSPLNHPVMMITDKLGVVITSSETEFNLCEIKSRFISGWITSTIIQVSTEFAKKGFLCVHDDKLQVYRIKKLLKKQLQSFVETL